MQRKMTHAAFTLTTCSVVCVLYVIVMLLVRGCNGVRGGVDRTRTPRLVVIAVWPDTAKARRQESDRKSVSNPALAPLFYAIMMVESGGDDSAVGDNGLSRGPYQISSAYWADAIEYGKVQWDYHELVWSRPHCEQVMRWYWERYHATSDEDRARLHNGGPSMRGTDDYWAKVQKYKEVDYEEGAGCNDLCLSDTDACDYRDIGKGVQDGWQCP